MILAACAALAACGSNEADETAGDDAAASAGETTGDVAATDMAGTYEITMSDGRVAIQTLNADGTYSDTIDGQVTESGTWRQSGDQLCYTAQGAASESCYSGGPANADGSFEVTGPDGTVSSTVRRIEG